MSSATALLPSDRRLGRHRTFEGSQIRHPDSGDALEGTWLWLSLEGVTRFAWIQAVFHLFIHHYTGADDFCTGTGFANRRDPRFSQDAGDGDQHASHPRTFRDRIATFRDAAAERRKALRFYWIIRRLAFEIVVNDLNPGRDAEPTTRFSMPLLPATTRRILPLADQGLKISSEDGISCGQVKFDLVALLIPGRHDVSTPSTELSAPLLIWEIQLQSFSISTGKTHAQSFSALLESRHSSARRSRWTACPWLGMTME